MPTIKVRYWLDSGANIHSSYEGTFEIGSEDWEAMSTKEKDDYAREYAWDRIDWGYCVVEEGD